MWLMTIEEKKYYSLEDDHLSVTLYFFVAPSVAKSLYLNHKTF